MKSRATRRDVPLYEMVDSLMRKRLVDNTWPPGAMLPSEMQLAREFGVSQGTVRRALEGLVAEGLVQRRQGLGTFVSEMNDRRSLFLFFNMVGEDGRQEMPGARLIDAGGGEADEVELARLRLRPGARVRRLLRLRLFKGQPAIVERVAVPEALMPDLGVDTVPPDHLFRHYELTYRITVVEAEESLRAVAATPAEASLLDLPSGTPLLEIARVAYTLDRTPVEFRISRCNTAEHSYRITRG